LALWPFTAKLASRSGLTSPGHNP